MYNVKKHSANTLTIGFLQMTFFYYYFNKMYQFALKYFSGVENEIKM